MLNIQNAVERTIVEISGPLDCVKVADYKSRIYQLIESAKRPVFLDLSKVNFIDPSGVGLISTLFRGLQSIGFTLTVGNLSGQPLDFMEKLNVLDALGYVPTTHTFASETSTQAFGLEKEVA